MLLMALISLVSVSLNGAFASTPKINFYGFVPVYLLVVLLRSALIVFRYIDAEKIVQKMKDILFWGARS
jgi:hypothetical protein